MSEADAVHAGSQVGEGAMISDFLVKIGFDTTGLADLERAGTLVRGMTEGQLRLECLRLALGNFTVSDLVRASPEMQEKVLGGIESLSRRFASIVLEPSKANAADLPR